MHTLPRSRTVCLSTSGSKNVYTISATSSLPDSSLHKDVLLIMEGGRGGEGRNTLDLRVFNLMRHTVDEVSLLAHLLSGLVVRVSLHRLQNDILEVLVHCTLVHSHHLQGEETHISRGRRPISARGGDPHQQGEETHISRGRRPTSAGGGDTHQQGEETHISRGRRPTSAGGALYITPGRSLKLWALVPGRSLIEARGIGE